MRVKLHKNCRSDAANILRLATTCIGGNDMNDSTRVPRFPANLEDYALWVAEHGLLEPYGMCQCGCGQETNLAPCTDASKSWLKNHPIRYLFGHAMRKYHSLEDVFFSSFTQGDPNECWEWESGTRCGQDGQYGLVAFGSKAVGAHRFSYEFHNGEIPNSIDGQPTVIRHKCDNKLCVNWHHLEAGTHKDNVQDSIDRGMHPRGEKAGPSKLTEADVRIIRRMKKRGMNHKEISEKFEVHPTTVGKIVRRQTWKHI